MVFVEKTCPLSPTTLVKFLQHKRREIVTQSPSCLQNPPWQIVSYDEAVTMQFSGLIFDIVEHLSIKLNFTYSVLNPTKQGEFKAANWSGDSDSWKVGKRDDKIWHWTVQLTQTCLNFLFLEFHSKRHSHVSARIEQSAWRSDWVGSQQDSFTGRLRLYSQRLSEKRH